MHCEAIQRLETFAWKRGSINYLTKRGDLQACWPSMSVSCNFERCAMSSLLVMKYFSCQIYLDFIVLVTKYLTKAGRFFPSTKFYPGPYTH